MRVRKSFLLLLNLIFSTFTLLFRFLLSCHHRHKSAHNLERRAPRGRGCLKCVLNALVFVTVLWLEWKGRTEPAEWAQTCLTRPDGIVGFKAHVLCVGMLEICPLSCPIHAILRTSLWLHSVTPAYRFFICAEDPVFRCRADRLNFVSAWRPLNSYSALFQAWKWAPSSCSFRRYERSALTWLTGSKWS